MGKFFGKYNYIELSDSIFTGIRIGEQVPIAFYSHMRNTYDFFYPIPALSTCARQDNYINLMNKCISNRYKF